MQKVINKPHKIIVIGLTGSIGMGKSTISSQLARLGGAVCDSDAIVHKLLACDGEAFAKVKNAFPQAIENNQINRKVLGKIVFSDKQKLKILESILHPLVEKHQEIAISNAATAKKKFIVLDIPLLFEAGREQICDYTIVVSAPKFLQRQRVLKRANMTKEKFENILLHQMPDLQKRRLADFVILSGLGKHHSLKQLKRVISRL